MKKCPVSLGFLLDLRRKALWLPKLDVVGSNPIARFKPRPCRTGFFVAYSCQREGLPSVSYCRRLRQLLPNKFLSQSMDW